LESSFFTYTYRRSAAAADVRATTQTGRDLHGCTVPKSKDDRTGEGEEEGEARKWARAQFAQKTTALVMTRCCSSLAFIGISTLRAIHFLISVCRLRPHRPEHRFGQVLHHVIHHHRHPTLSALHLKHRGHHGDQLQVDLLEE
jgi:hypothetical protein